ncbi:hypothetical protein [Aliikangiella sp. G2MR2-5]|uniref:hypothetical protein n=1 Tax=Aliikangiella sp. G2MR2-5 TaxID=2788943 RepID=UPI001AEEF90B|nr:hypothetical protein [Aliikangiella sp. G2MR2-5]
MKLRSGFIFRITAITIFYFTAFSAIANHAWGSYHWARTTTSFDLRLVDSTTSDWSSYVTQAVVDWSNSSVLNIVEETGDTSTRTRRKCNAQSGTIRICNLAYGQNGWLGIAGISVDSNGHIVKGYTKLNDTYFAWDYYNNPLWKQSVTCQELGHDIGLGHQDEDFNNQPLFSCMDYQDPPYPEPNQHDYNQLEAIYGHTDSYDSFDTGGGGGDSGCNSPPGKGCNKSSLPDSAKETGWGMSLGRRGNSETFIRIDPDGTRHLTHVRWVGHQEHE